MELRHKDRTGKPWTFQLDCTPVQGRLVQRLLTFVRCLGNQEELTVTYLADWEENTAFRNTLEHVVLSAVQEWDGTPMEPPKPLEEPPTFQEPAPPPETTATKPPTFSTNTKDDDDGRIHYYWENF